MQSAEVKVSALRLTDVSKVFPNRTVALAGVDLTVGEGEFVAVVGPSGCGKSTLLRLAAGLDEPSHGSVEVDRRELGYVFQDPTLLPWRSVRKNVGFFAEVAGLGSQARRARVDAAIALVGLSGFEEELPHRLSGGMKMRVSMARALVNDPRLLLLDEPFGALDEITREALQDELIRLRDERGFSALLITHSVSEAVYLADRVVVMTGRPGRVSAVLASAFPHRDEQLRYSAEFAAVAADVSRALREGGA